MAPSPTSRRKRLPQSAIALIAFVIAGAMAFLAAGISAAVIERHATETVSKQLSDAGLDWAEVKADGLQVILSGTAPTEAQRFRALNLAGAEVDSSRLRDTIEVTPSKGLEAPRFSVEILRNDREIQLIGLFPQDTDRAALAARMTALASGGSVTDMLESAMFPAPPGWDAAMEFALNTLDQLPRSKISVTAEKVSITAIAESEGEKRALVAAIEKMKPKDVEMALDISAPRPVLTPFTLRFVIDEAGARFDACSADSAEARDAILAAARAVGMTGEGGCVLGLGVPSPHWAEAAETAIKAVAELGQGSVTFSDADVTLEAAPKTAQAVFDRVVGDLDAALPDAFSLQAKLLVADAAAAAGPAEFTAALAKDSGKVELRGRLTDEALRAAVESYARAAFGTGNVLLATRPDESLPAGWPLRVLAGLQALAVLDYGNLVVRPDTVEVSGVSGKMTARAKISQILSAKLGKGASFKVDVRYDEALDPLAALPTPQECAATVKQVFAGQKIAFTPGSAEIDASAGPLLDQLALALKPCNALHMEIAGHTDSQGSEGGNKSLSQARAEAVLLALQGRRVDVSAMVAVGYGEARPIADNGTEEGREANRRIEFTLLELPVAPVAGQGGAADARGSGAAPANGVSLSGANAPAAGPDFSADTSPSVAPQTKTRRPKSRPANAG